MDRRIPILMYHKVAPMPRQSTLKGHYVTPNLFSKQVRLLRALKFESVALSDVVDRNFEMPKRPIAITFDDGYANFSMHALPTLARHRYTATVFLVVNQIGGLNRWDIDSGDVEEPLMSLEMIQSAKGKGIEFGSHTLDHADLTAISPENAWTQIHESRRRLEEILNTRITAFCYPYGRKSKEIIELVDKAGYKTACSTEKGPNTLTTDPLALKRINVRSDTITPVFLLKLLRTARHGK